MTTGNPSQVFCDHSIPQKAGKESRLQYGHILQVLLPLPSVHGTPCEDAKIRQLNFSAAVSLGRLFFLSDYITDVLFRLVPGCHYFMAAAKALQSKVRTGAQNFPLLLPTRMGLLHHKNITKLNIH
jgi:hypothetical protein